MAVIKVDIHTCYCPAIFIYPEFISGEDLDSYRTTIYITEILLSWRLLAVRIINLAA